MMLAGIFAAKKRAAYLHVARNKKKIGAVSGRGPDYLRAIRNRAAALHGRPVEYPSNDYGLAGGAMAGDASAPGDAIAPLSSVVFL